MQIERQAVEIDRTCKEKARLLDCSQYECLEELETLRKERDCMLEQAQRQDTALLAALHCAIQAQEKIRCNTPAEMVSVQQERDAALERAMAAEGQIHIWFEKTADMECVWPEWRLQMEQLGEEQGATSQWAEAAEKQLGMQTSEIQSLTAVIEKLEGSCLWWEALAAEMKHTTEVAEEVAIHEDHRFDSMDEAYRSVWKDRSH